MDSRRGQSDSCSCFEPLEPRLLLSSSLLPTYNLPLEAPTHAACDPSLDSPHTQGIDILNQGGGSGGIVPGLLQDTGTAWLDGGVGVYLHSGELFVDATDLEIPGRGFNWKFERKYRSGVEYEGPLGHNWFLNYSQRLVVVTEGNQEDLRRISATLAPGDVIRADGYGRVDIYLDNGDGTYASPAGCYALIACREDGSFAERDRDGYIAEYAPPDGQSVSRLLSLSDRQGNTMAFQYDGQGRLVTAIDTLGRPITYNYNGDRLDWVEDFIGRRVSFAYGTNGDLVAVTSPAVTGTPNGNDFPDGVATGYSYSSGFADPTLNHNLLAITAPNEMASSGPPRIVVAYQTDPESPDLDRVLSQSIGGSNESEVPAGGTILYSYWTLGSAPPGDFATPVFQATVTDRNGNQARYQTNQLGNIVSAVEYTNRGIRTWEGDYTSTYQYNADSELLEEILPEGNSIEWAYDSGNPDRWQQGNLLSETRWPDADRGGDQSSITTAWTYEPIYNQVRTSTDARGYTTTFTFDYQEGSDYAGLAARLGTTEAQVMALLTGVTMNLGDVNGDGLTNQISGNVIRIDQPTVNLPTGSNQAAVEGDTGQEIVWLYAYNAFGQITRQSDPEGNVDRYEYYPARDPDGDGTIDNPAGDPITGGYLRQIIRDDASAPVRDSGTNPTPAGIRRLYRYDRVGNVIREVDGRGIATDYAVNQLNRVVQITRGAATDVYGPDPSEPLGLVTFGYLERLAYDANGNVVLRQVEDRGNTSVGEIGTFASLLEGDANQDGHVDDSDLSIVLTYLGTESGATWRQGDFDGNEAVDDTDFAILLANFGANKPLAFVDTQYQYDIMGHLLRTEQEVKAGDSLVTRYRYDRNGHLVLAILPEGNATTSRYDERDLLYWSVRGATTTPPLVRLAVGDPTNYNVRGGISSRSTFHYDGNRNLIESVDPADTDLSPANNSNLGGPGDRTRYIYDGFDRRTSMVDSVGNQTVWQYDPAGNVVRESCFGPTGGPSPASDGPEALPRPVSSNGVIQTANLVNSNLLSATEYQYDELGRNSQTDRVLLVNTIATVRPPDVSAGASVPQHEVHFLYRPPDVRAGASPFRLQAIGLRLPSDVRAGASDLGKGNPAASVARRLSTAAPGNSTLITAVFDNATVASERVTTRYEYDRDSRLTFTVEDDGDTSRTFYDGAGRVIRTLDPESNTVEYAYDRNSNLIETRRTDVAQVAGVTSEVFLTTYFYDSLDRLQRKVDNLGGTFEYRYDSRNNLVATADAQGPLSGATVARRAFAGGALTVNALNGPGNVTLNYYDGQSRLIRQETILTAAGSGDGIRVGATLEGTKTDPPPPDPTQGGGDGIIRTGRSYDDNSLPSAEIDDQGNVTLYLYDNLNRPVAETKGLTTASALLDKALILGPRQIVTPTVATIDNPAYISTDKIDAQLASAKARLDEVAPLFPALADRVDDNPPTTIVYGYDQDGNLLILEDENDTEVFGRFDAINRRIATRVFRWGQADSHLGDPLFAPNPVSDPSNPSTTLPPVIGTTKQDFQYDGLSRLTWAADNNDPADTADDSVITFAYDSLSRVIEETQQIGPLTPKTVSSAWQADNLRTSLTYPNGRVVLYTYDALDRLDTVADQGATAAIADYDWIGTDRVLQRNSPLTGTRTTYLDDTGTLDIGYDGLGRPVLLRDLRSDDSLIVGFTYTYDRMGNKLTEGKLHDWANSERYAYDSAYRLVSFDRPNPGAIAPMQSDWTLDGAGNWEQVDDETREHSSFNEITERTAGGTTTPIPILSDDNGNEIDDGTFTFEWDFRNRLRRATRKSDATAVGVYSYDALDRRIRTVVTMSPSVTTDFYYDGQREIEERNGADVLAQQYVYGVYIDEPLVLDRNLDGDDSATGPGDSRLAYHQNALFSVYALTDTVAVIREGYLYDAYGRQTVFQHGPNGVVDWGGDDWITPGGASGPGNPFMFTGRRLDAETGLYYYRARYLDPEEGRFISRDNLCFTPYETEMTRLDLAGGDLPPMRQTPAPPNPGLCDGGGDMCIDSDLDSEPLPRILAVPSPLPFLARKFPFRGDPGFWALPPENYHELPGFWVLPPENYHELPGFWALPDPRWDVEPNLYEYGRGNPGMYVDPLGREASNLGIDLAKLLLKLSPVEREIDKAKEGLKDWGLGIYNSMSTFEKALTIAFGAGAAYKYFDRVGSINTGNLTFALGSNLELSLSLTLEKAPGGGTTLAGSAGLKLTF